MSLYRLLLRSTTKPTSLLRALSLSSPPTLQFHRPFAFSSAEEAAAERRKRKRRLRIEPPRHAMRSEPPARDPNAPRMPDSTSALVGPRLNIHNRVQSLIRAFDLDAASYVARHSVFGRFRPTVFTCNAIIAAMYRAKRYNDAVALFKYFFEQFEIVPNVVSYNNLINSHCDAGRVDRGLEVYKHIIANGVSPSAVTYRHLTKGLIDAGRIDEAVDLLREMLNRGQGADSLVFNNVIKGFLDLDNLERANEFFDELKERCLVYDGVVSATFMDWWFKQGKDKEAMESYKSLMDKNFRMVPATCNVLLEVLLKYGKKDVASTLFETMLDNHTPPTFQAVNFETFNVMVNYLMKEGKIADAVDAFKKAGTKPGSKPFAMDVAGYNNIISRFCEIEMLTEAEQFFVEMQNKHLTPDVTSFRLLIDAYLKMGRIDDALRLFDQMVRTGLWVVASYGTRLFNEFISNGKAVESADILLKMLNIEKEPKPDPSLYDIVIRGLCDVSEFEKCKEILNQMMRHDIGVPPALKEFLIEAFGKVGKSEEIKKILDESRWASTATYNQMPQANRRYSQNVGSGQSQMASEESLRQHELGKQAPNGTPQMTWTQSSGFRGISGEYQTGQQQSGNYQMGGQPTLWDNQMGGQQQSWNSQMGGQKPQFQDMSGQQQSGYHHPVGQQSGNYYTGGHESWNGQMEGQKSGNYQVERQQHSWKDQAGGLQSGNYHTGGQPESWNNQMGGQQQGNYQTRGQQHSWDNQMGGQQSSWNSQRQQPSWNSQRPQSGWNTQVGGPQQSSWETQIGQLPSNSSYTGAQQQQQQQQQISGQLPSNSGYTGAQQQQQQISGQLPFRSFQNAGQQSSSMVSQHHPVPARVAGQYQGKSSQQQFDQESRWQRNQTEELSDQNFTGPRDWQQNQTEELSGLNSTGPRDWQQNQTEESGQNFTGPRDWQQNQAEQMSGQNITGHREWQQHQTEEMSRKNSTGHQEWQEDKQQVAV